uniref:Rhamnogalacturonan lyase domain-containing protein n=1 Tax=Thermogemmatispora argillosa TaxID=2045280 RepID=A0A455T4D6_9CHLR|nr:hypothetical protein KTA_28990 [Thermogemmatispora argillosa]
MLSISYVAPGRCALYGLLSRVDSGLDSLAFEGAQAELLSLEKGERKRLAASNGRPLLTTRIDRDGKLLFSSVSPGRYTLLLHLSTGDLVIEELHIDMCEVV